MNTIDTLQNSKLELLKVSQAFIFSVLYYLLLCFIYEVFVSKVYLYMGFRNYFSSYSFLIAIFGFFINFLIFAVFIIEFKGIVSTVLTVLFYISFIPGNILFAFRVTTIEFFLFFQTYWAIFGMFARILMCSQRQLPIPPKRVKYFFSVFICLFMSSTILFVFAYYARFRFMFDFLNVYDLRLDARTYSIPLPVIYLLGFARASIPIYLGYVIIKKKWWIGLLLSLIQFCSFSIDGSKTIYFITLIVVVIAFFYNDFLYGLIPMFAFTALALFQILSFMGFNLVNSLIVRRTLFLPALISYSYYDFVKSTTPSYFGNLLKYLGMENHNPDISFLVGELYFKRPGSSANNGLFGDAFWNLGVLGIIFMPVLISLFLYLLNSITAYLSTKMRIIVSIIVSVSLLNSSFTTMLLSHGMAFLVVVLYFLPNDVKKN